MPPRKKTAQLALAGDPPLAGPKPAPGRLTVARLTVHGVLGIKDSTIDLDTITVLAGANATAKSSHLKALRSALGVDRTALARLARLGDGPEDPEGPSVEVLLVGEDREVQVTRKGAGSPEVRERVGEDWRVVPRPVEWLRQLIDVEAANPAAWLASDDETRATAVLAAMPLEGYDRAAALRAAGLDGFRLPPIPAGLHPLEDLEQIEAAVFNSRTEVNRQERAEADAAAKLLAGLPAEVPKDAGETVARLAETVQTLGETIARDGETIEPAERQALEVAAATFQTAQDRITSDFKRHAGELRAAHDRQAAEIRAAAERRVAELLAETEAAIAALKNHGEAEIGAAHAREEATRDIARARAQEARQALEMKRRELATGRERLAALREQQRAAETDRHVRATAEEAKAKAREHAARSAALTAGIEALKRYRLLLAERLPVPNLRVHFDEKGRKSLLLGDVPLSQLNTAELVKLATEVSLLRSQAPSDGRPVLSLILLDGIEALDHEARAALMREVAARGSQIIACCVGEGPLRILRGVEATW